MWNVETSFGRLRLSWKVELFSEYLALCRIRNVKTFVGMSSLLSEHYAIFQNDKFSNDDRFSKM